MGPSISNIDNIKSIILIVDDSSDILALNRILLEAEGFEVFTSQSGVEALELLSKIKEPNLILLDMQMAEMNGIEFLNSLEMRQPQIVAKVPIVFMTGMNKVPTSKAVGYIRKPMDIDKFIEVIDHFIKMGVKPHN